MSNINEETQLRDDINKKLDSSGYGPKLKSIRIRRYSDSAQTGVTSSEISHEFERGYFSDTELARANLYVSGLKRELLDSDRF